MNLGENVGSQNNFASEGAKISLQLGTNSLHYVLARTGTCHDHEASFVRTVRPVLGPWKLI